MTTESGRFRVKSWDEQAGEAVEGLALTRVRAGMTYEGVIEGEGLVEFVMVSPEAKVTTFVGLERVVGRIGGRSGAAVFQHAGTFADGVARSDWRVVPNSGTGGLRGLRGEGRYGEQKADAEHGGAAPLTFSFAFDDE